MAQAKRDENRVPTLIGVSNADGSTPVTVYVDPTTHRVLISGVSSPGGSDTQVQFNDGGTLSGDAGFTYNKTTDVVTVGGLVIPSTGTGIMLYNTSDQVTNYERGFVSWGTNVLTFGAQVGGTGTLRQVRYQGSDALRYFQIDTNGTPKFSTVAGSTSATTVSAFTGTLTSTTSVQSFISVAPTISQSSTGGYTAILINPTESSTGSGAKRLISAQVGGSDKFVVDNAGAVTAGTYNGLTVSTTTGTLTITNGKTLSVTNTLTLSGTDGTTITFPSTSATLARTDAANTFTGASTASAWVLTSPTITTSIVPTSNDGAALGSTSNQFSDLFLAEGGVINWDNGDVTLTQTGNSLNLAGGEFNFGANTAYFTETDNGNSSTADTIDWKLSNKQKSTLTGNCTFTFTAPSGPCSLLLKLVQDGTGSRTVTWPAAVHWSGGSAPTLTTTANRVDIITFYYDGSTYFGSSALNFVA